jgi:hypothetical protein
MKAVIIQEFRNELLHSDAMRNTYTNHAPQRFLRPYKLYIGHNELCSSTIALSHSPDAENSSHELRTRSHSFTNIQYSVP